MITTLVAMGRPTGECPACGFDLDPELQKLRTIHDGTPFVCPVAEGGCGQKIRIDVSADVRLRAEGKQMDTKPVDGDLPLRPETAPDSDPIAGPLIPGDHWNGTAGGPEESDPFGESGTRHSAPGDCPTWYDWCRCVSEEPATPPPAPGEWKISDLAELDRVLARMARKERFKAENRALVEREIARLRQWEANENAALERSRASDEAHVRVFVEANRETLGRYRNLPHGRVEWKRRKEGTYRWRQDMAPKEREAALLAWVKHQETHRALTERGPERPNLEEIKAFLFSFHKEQAPLAPPGLEWVPPGETLTISVEEKR